MFIDCFLLFFLVCCLTSVCYLILGPSHHYSALNRSYFVLQMIFVLIYYDTIHYVVYDELRYSGKANAVYCLNDISENKRKRKIYFNPTSNSFKICFYSSCCHRSQNFSWILRVYYHSLICIFFLLNKYWHPIYEVDWRLLRNSQILPLC